MGPRVYCSVYGCMNSSILKPEFSFFKLPADDERRAKWLYLISREDLVNKPPQNYTVCEEHFEPLDILPGKKRKKLKTNSLPSLYLPDLTKRKEQAEQPQFEQKRRLSKKKARRLQKQVQELCEIRTFVEQCVQTEDTTTVLANDYTETVKSPSSDTQRKRKLKSENFECKKKFKHDADSETGKHQKDHFHKLCDKFLTKDLAELVKAQTHFKYNNARNRYHQIYKLFCLKLYFISPQAYRALQSALCLPCPKVLSKHGDPVTTEINDKLMSILKTKVEAMTDLEKNCSVLVDTMSLKANLLYNIKQDKIIGFQEINGVQSPIPARNAVVVMVRGLFAIWKQPVGYALLSDCTNNDEVEKWIDELLEKLVDIGLNIRAFVSDIQPELFNVAQSKSVTIERPCFFVNNRKVYYIFDSTTLIKLVRDDLIAYDFHCQDRVAKYEHIVKFYDIDKQKSMKIAQGLTNSHIYPNKLEKSKVHFATELFSNPVVAGISTYIDFNVIEESGRGTVELIKNMSNLLDALNSSNLKGDSEYRRAFRGKETQVTFFNEMLNYFQHLKVIDTKNGKDVTSDVKFIQGFQITIRSILLLFEDLKSDGCRFLMTKKLNKDVLENLFGQLLTKTGLATKPTSWQFISAYQKIFFAEIMKSIRTDRCADDLGSFLVQINSLRELNAKASFNEDKVDNDNGPQSDVDIMSSEYNQPDLLENNSLFYVSSYLLKKCAEYHNDCQILKSYMTPNQAAQSFGSEPRYQRYRDYCKQTNSSLLVVPADHFVKYIEKIDEVFRQCFDKDHIDCKIAEFIYKEIDRVGLLVPCPCFPLVYLKKLFIRMKIFYTVKFNNRAFRTSHRSRKYFSVSNFQ